VTNTRGSSANEEAALKLLYPALRNHSQMEQVAMMARGVEPLSNSVAGAHAATGKQMSKFDFVLDGTLPQTPGFSACGQARLLCLYPEQAVSPPVSGLGSVRRSGCVPHMLRQATGRNLPFREQATFRNRFTQLCLTVPADQSNRQCQAKTGS
jgi:hypothetical protein